MSILTSSLLALCTVSVAVAAFVCLYHLGLMAIAPFCQRGSRCRNQSPSHSFAIVIPAHNEEAGIKRTLDSCAALDYPKQKVAVFVIADNCSDQTAKVATACGTICLTRQDDTKRGKGFALEWALPQVLAAGHDAVLVLDADCLIDSHALLVFDEHLRRGDRALQASDIVANPDESPTSYVLALANVLENDCFYAPKSVLGLAVMLRGTGMAFHRDILTQFPWRARSIAEDAEYSLHLLRSAVRIRFVPNVHVRSDFPIRQDELTIQRSRWIGGGIRLAAAWGPQLAGEGLRTFRPVLLDAVLTMFIVSRPLVIAQFLLAALLSLLCWSVSPGRWSMILLGSNLAILIGYMTYAAAGVARLGVRGGRARLLLHIPTTVARYLLVAVRSLLGARSAGWKRRPRIEPNAATSSAGCTGIQPVQHCGAGVPPVAGSPGNQTTPAELPAR